MSHRFRFLFVVLSLTVCAFTPSAKATVRFVKPGATGTGANWGDASGDIQAMINASSSINNDQVWVAAGTYKPGATRGSTFSLASGIAVYGGFAGTESNLSERPTPCAGAGCTTETILSGDINGDDGSPFTNRTDNCYHVVTANGVDNLARLDGFTITGGLADDTATNGTQGAGLLIKGSNSSPQIVRCTITANVAHRQTGHTGTGGGVASVSSGSLAAFTNCVLSNNEAARRGGGVFLQDSTIQFSGCQFTGNFTGDSSDDGGGAVYMTVVSASGDFKTKFTSCDFGGNYTNAASGGALFVTHDRCLLESRSCSFTGNGANGGSGLGGAVYVGSAGQISLINSRFAGNEAFGLGGGAVAIGPDVGLPEHDPPVFSNQYIVNCQFVLNTVSPSSEGYGGGLWIVKPSSGPGGTQLLNYVWVTNCLFYKNTAKYGGAIFSMAHNANLENEPPARAIFTNVTVADNSTDTNGEVGGIGFENNESGIVYNSILWGNTDDSTSTTASGEQIRTDALVEYSCVTDGHSGTGNISSDPKFANATDSIELQRNYRLLPCSPAIDVADYDSVPADDQNVDDDASLTEKTPDLDLHVRTVDFLGHDPAEDIYPDMGAYEHIAPVCSLLGDLNTDSAVDGLDIQPFLECVFNAPTTCPCADFNQDDVVDYHDAACFANRLLDDAYSCAPDCGSFERGYPDCNTNGIADITDLALGTSQDCNTNGVPDECDVDEGDPDGNELVSDDVNTDGVPDECEVDCNTNGVPDAWDISQTTSDDANTNGIPDECETDCNANDVPDVWDLAQATSADCNANGTPDECEPDCNSNGVPDDCDVDPEDPDGDESVSPDCNGNGWPDECDLAIPPGFAVGSLDCNTNGIPDECDIASCESDPACGDCNSNGIPDACDIAAEISTDADTDGIPDECEEENLMGGGSSMMTGGGEGDEAAAWETFYEWSAGQCWGPTCEEPMDVQFAALVAKLQDLGLPVRGSQSAP